jgi:hypothetical protein
VPHKYSYSYSQIQTYASCPLKYRLKYVDQLVPLQGESSHDLNYGKAIDAALNTYYLTGSIDKAQSAFTFAYPESQYPSSLPYWSPGKTHSNGLAAIAAYVERWREDDEHWTVVSVQSVSVQPEPAESLDRLVRIDLVIRDDRDGLIYGVDHKTTGKYLTKDYWAQFSPHSQIRQYVDQIQKQYGECGGFYINALGFRHRTKAYTPRTGPDKGVQLPAGDWYDFKRMVFNPNTEAITAERDNWEAWTSRIERDRESGLWGYNTNQCVRGPIVCEFHQMCEAGYQWPRDRELIESYYRERCIRHAKDGERCWLAPDHLGDHDSTRPEQAEFEIEIAEENVEQAI